MPDKLMTRIRRIAI